MEFPKWLSTMIGMSVPILIPVVHFGLVFRLWDKYNQPVDKKLCSCSCWDTVFKGPYETGVGGYKHLYFNSNGNTAMIWFLTVMSVIALYESVKHCIATVLKGTQRWRMVILFGSVVYPHYWTWWVFVNYYNDDFYKQFWHQLFFTVTELASTAVVLHLVSNRNNITPRKILFIMGVASLHILASGWDQFVANVLKQEGQLHQVLRDIGLMVPDILHLMLPWQELKIVAKRRNAQPSQLISLQDFAVCALVIGALLMFCSFIL